MPVPFLHRVPMVSGVLHAARPPIARGHGRAAGDGRYCGRVAGQRWTSTWISGVRAAGADLGSPGERLGLPKSGQGSIAGFPRRAGALLVDWLICMAIAQWLIHWPPLATLALFAVENIVLVVTASRTVGMRLLGIGVVSASAGGRPQPLMVVVRTLLLCTVIPAVIWDRDQRGMHDRASDTVVVRG